MDAHRSTSFDARLRDREPLIGTSLTLPSVALAELVAAPLDFVWIDLEHGALGGRDVLPLCVAARAAGCAALARLPSADPPDLAAILDAGVDGVVAPRVRSADQARRLVDRLRHPPRGSRGHAARRASAYGAQTSVDPLCWAQVECAAGVEAAGEIAAVDGVDALVVGCADLALALEGTLDAASPRMREAIGHVQDAADSRGVASGVAGPDDPALLRELAGGRSSVLVCSADVRVYARAIRGVAEALRRPALEVAGVGA